MADPINNIQPWQTVIQFTWRIKLQIDLKPKVTLQCYYISIIYLFWVLVSGILNVFNSY